MMAANYHAVALALLARPALEPAELAWLAGLEPVADLLWHADRNEANTANAVNPAQPDVTAFTAGLDSLMPAAALQPPAFVVDALRCVPDYWRLLPDALVAAMARRLSQSPLEPDPKIGALEVQHLARWWVETSQPSKRSTKDWASLLAQAQQWQCHPELELRQQPSSWPNPLVAKVNVSGFTVEFIGSTAQLVNSGHHKGLLCNLATRDAATARLAAWFYATPVLLTDDSEFCLIALTRDALGSKWHSPEVFAPGHFKDLLTRAACSLIAQDESAVGLAAIRRATMAVRPSALDAMALLRGM